MRPVRGADPAGAPAPARPRGPRGPLRLPAVPILFDHRPRRRHFRLLPDRRLPAVGFRPDDAAWEQLRIPVDLAFFFHSTPSERVVAFYPAPWARRSRCSSSRPGSRSRARTRCSSELEEDVEALLVNRRAAARPLARPGRPLLRARRADPLPLAGFGRRPRGLGESDDSSTACAAAHGHRETRDERPAHGEPESRQARREAGRAAHMSGSTGQRRARTRSRPGHPAGRDRLPRRARPASTRGPHEPIDPRMPNLLPPVGRDGAEPPSTEPSAPAAPRSRSSRRGGALRGRSDDRRSARA